MRVASCCAAFALACAAALAWPSAAQAQPGAVFNEGGDKEADGAKFVVTLEGMMCESCAKAVKGALAKIDGVAHVSVQWQQGTAKVTMKAADGALTEDQVKKALADHKDFTVKEVKAAK